MLQKRICIIGAGISGLSAGYQLLKQNNQVLFIEKSFKVSGRATTRTKNGYIYDNGATTLSYSQVQEQDVIKNLVNKVTNDYIPIEQEILTFDQNNQIKPRQEKKEQYFGFKNGIMSFGNGLKKHCEDLGANFMLSQNALNMQQFQNGWKINYKLDQTHLRQKQYVEINQITCDQVLFTMPSVQTLNFIQNSLFNQQQIQDQLINDLQKIQYSTCLSLVFGVNMKMNKNFYGMVNSDGNHDISWVHFEDQKEGHVQENKSLIIVQMSHKFSINNYNEDKEHIFKLIQKQLDQLDIFITREQIDFFEIKKWKYAFPLSNYEYKDLNQNQLGIFFAGDYTTQKGKVFTACESGLKVAQIMDQQKY